MANDVNQMPKGWTSAYQNILIKKKKRLYSPNFSSDTLKYKIQVLELGMDRVVYQIVIAVIFVL